MKTELELIHACDDGELQMYLHSYRTKNNVEFRLGCIKHNIVLTSEERFCPECFNEGEIKEGEMAISQMRFIPTMEQIFDILGDKFESLIKGSDGIFRVTTYYTYKGQSAYISLIKALKGVIYE